MQGGQAVAHAGPAALADGALALLRHAVHDPEHQGGFTPDHQSRQVSDPADLLRPQKAVTKPERQAVAETEPGASASDHVLCFGPWSRILSRQRHLYESRECRHPVRMKRCTALQRHA